jgi:hypothetical protein
LGFWAMYAGLTRAGAAQRRGPGPCL